MNTTALLMGIVPLLAFVIVDSLAGMKAALITTVVLAIGEAIMTFVLFGELDSVTWFSLFTVLLMAMASYRWRSPLYLKMQPVVLSCIFSMVLLISYFSGHPMLYEMAIKYQHFYGPEVSSHFKNPAVISLLINSTWTVGIGLLLHAAVTAWAALKLNNWWWIAVRGVGFYLFCFLAFFAAKFFVTTNF
jgi:hypothetical protein